MESVHIGLGVLLGMLQFWLIDILPDVDGIGPYIGSAQPRPAPGAWHPQGILDRRICTSYGSPVAHSITLYRTCCHQHKSIRYLMRQLVMITNTRGISPINNKPGILMSQRAAAIDMVFGHQDATPGNASWLTLYMIFMILFVKAVTKITNIKNNLKNNHQLWDTRGPTDMQTAEIETARILVAIVTKTWLAK
ncbi:hypothetical protein M752DRAFT_324468 [Aspergillus phoenicis ATCC 13157]|uniref:Uncharacterized protein n=1 Tax=Aspergillus phoenicis ATCC 13157 TaxID=1353007 RepID=A0A370PTQ6_ASPPH|nr:hypothetical protein M752DRAFT_324468 [Aspergillus phoenicis ATCC 13157]